MDYREMTDIIMQQSWSGLQWPTREHVLDRLIDLLLGADELLSMVRDDGTNEQRQLVPHLQSVYDKVDSMLKEMTD